MTTSSNYITMQLQIADDLGDRQDLLAPLSDETLTLSPIQAAIQNAIARWERRSFYFNELLIDVNTANGTSPWNTVNGQEYYGAADYANIPLFSEIKKLWVYINAQRYVMTPRTFSFAVDTSVNPTVTGIPIDYEYADEQIRMYPIPNGAYPVFLWANLRLAALVNNTDANAWTKDAENLIRAEAKRILAEDTLHDDDLRQRMTVAIHGHPEEPESRGYLFDLQAETRRRRRSGRVRPSHF